ncbi:GNAT family N-acetyltransferase [Chryseobacterium sp. MYb264]|uniref:GNAT family N-acetyltransferase n=1 Tax=Chryseobacterium sp. MYb264 TaxID=2745153 RepID=UPI002E107D75|nr:GNAT family N-acetyltransferase [Chryseobacterium sp. MYb264]
MKIISIRQQPEYKDKAIQYFQESWSEVYPKMYEDSITHAIGAEQDLPQWYLLEKDHEIIGCAGLITNDFISRIDLYPWICALFIDEKHRGHKYSSILLKKAEEDAREAGFKYLNLCTDHIGLYEKYGYRYIGQGYHPWEEESRMYQITL